MQKIYKHITPEQKLKQASLLYLNAMELKRSAIRIKYPELSKVEIEAKLKKLFENAAR